VQRRCFPGPRGRLLFARTLHGRGDRLSLGRHACLPRGGLRKVGGLQPTLGKGLRFGASHALSGRDMRSAIPLGREPLALCRVALSGGLGEGAHRFVDLPVAQLGERLERVLRRTHFPREA